MTAEHSGSGGRFELSLEIPGIRAWRVECAETDNPYLLLAADKPLKTLNSAPWGGGFGRHRLLVNRQVDKSYDCEDPIAEMAAFLETQGLAASDAACLLTAAHVADAGLSHAAYGMARVTSLVTVGLGNKARAGLAEPVPQLFPGTINAIVLVDGTMTDAAMVNAVLTATEAKVAALQALDERVCYLPQDAGGMAVGLSASGPPLYATGTTTDAVLIASTQRGPSHRYAGTATEVGHLIGRTVYEAAIASGRRYQSFASAKR